MPLGNDGVTVDLGRTFQLPVGSFFLFEAAFITDPVFHFPPLVLAGRDTEYLVSPVPQRHFPVALRVVAIAVGIYRLEEPDPVLKPEGLVRQGSYRAYVDDIAYKV